MNRQRQLDGLRGIAALIVVFHHWSLVVPGCRERLVDLYLPRLLVAGPQAVFVFFILSGFVLFQAFERYRNSGFLRWGCWRAARLWLPTMACVTLSALLANLLADRATPELSGWFNNDSWAVPVGALEWLRNVVPLDGRAYHQLDNATWSLVLELRLSLLFPLIALAVIRSWKVTLAATFLLSLFMPAFPGNSFDLLWTSRYLFPFAAGAVLAQHRQPLGIAFASSASRWRGVLLLVIALVALMSDPRLLMAASPLVAAGAILLVATSAFDESVARRLRTAPSLWLGRVSFSLYLVHLPILLAAVHLLHDRLPMFAIASAAIPLTLVAAAVLERLVERPALELSRWFLKRSAGPSPSLPIENGLVPAR